MLRLFAHANYDFIRVRRYAYAVTGLFILPGLLFLLVRGLNYSIEFTGGTLIQVESKTPVNVAAIRSGDASAAMGSAPGISGMVPSATRAITGR